MKPRTMLFLFLLVLTALRLVFIAQINLVGDEAYYYMWSQRLDWSYYSKGPGVAFVIRLGTMLFGANEFGVRFFSPMCALGTSLLMFFMARRLYGESVGIWTVLMMNVTPVFNGGSLLMTIDPLSIFFWTAAMFAFWLALEENGRFTFYWPLTGLLIGLGFLAKYTNAMQWISIFLVLGLTPRYRSEFLRFGFWAMLIVFLICTAPVIVWNEHHEWITWYHLKSRGGLNTGFFLSPVQFLTFVGGQLGIYSPLIFAGMMIALWKTRHHAAARFKPRFLVMFTLPVLVMYVILSLKKAGQPNWTAPAYISLGILTAAYWHEWMQQKASVRKWVGAAFVVGIAEIVVFLSLDVARGAGAPLPYKGDPLSRLRGWATTAEQVDDFRRTFEKETGKPVFLIGDNYQFSALLSFYLPEKRTEGKDHPAVYIPESQDIESEFSFWPKYDDFVDAPKPAKGSEDYYTEEQGVNLFIGRNALFITDDINDSPPSELERGFEKVEMVKLFNVTRHGLPLKQIRIFACYNYKTVPL